MFLFLSFYHNIMKGLTIYSNRALFVKQEEPPPISYHAHYKNMPVQIYWKFHLQKLKIFK